MTPPATLPLRPALWSPLPPLPSCAVHTSSPSISASKRRLRSGRSLDNCRRDERNQTPEAPHYRLDLCDFLERAELSGWRTDRWLPEAEEGLTVGCGGRNVTAVVTLTEWARLRHVVPCAHCTQSTQLTASVSSLPAAHVICPQALWEKGTPFLASLPCAHRIYKLWHCAHCS